VRCSRYTNEKESEVRIQKSEYTMPEVRGFKQGKNFSLCSKGLKRSALNHGSSTLLLSETRKGRQECSRTRVETPKTLTGDARSPLASPLGRRLATATLAPVT